MTLCNHIYTYLFICTTICPYLPSLIILIYAVCLVSYFRINLLTYTNAYMVISMFFSFHAGQIQYIFNFLTVQIFQTPRIEAGDLSLILLIPSKL